MILPLSVVIVNDTWAAIHNGAGNRVCAVYGDSAVADAFALANAVNEVAALKEKAERDNEFVRQAREAVNEIEAENLELRAELRAAKALNARREAFIRKYGMGSKDERGDSERDEKKQ